MRILVTGGSGFIGSNFIHYMLKKYPGYEIINLDKLAYTGNLESLEDVSHLPMYHFVQGDVCNEVEVDAMMGQGIDAVVHLAAEPYPNPEERDPSRFIRTDVYGAYVLAQAASAYKVGRFVHVSTAEGYGLQAAENSVRAAAETDELRPADAHVAARVGAEKLVSSFAYSHNLPITIVRATSVFGSYQYPDYGLAKLIVRAIRQEPLEIAGTGQHLADWLYVLDLCAALDVLLHGRKREVEGQIFNVGSGHQRTFIEIAELILHFLDRPRQLIQLQPGQPSTSPQAVDTTKIERLGWLPETDFHRGLTETIAWYQQHEDWWQELRHPSMVGAPMLLEEENLSEL